MVPSPKMAINLPRTYVSLTEKKYRIGSVVIKILRYRQTQNLLLLYEDFERKSQIIPSIHSQNYLNFDEICFKSDIEKKHLFILSKLNKTKNIHFLSLIFIA